MGFSWKQWRVERLYGLDLKSNPLLVKDGFSLDLQNCYQNSNGVAQKRSGGTVMFASDETSTTEIDEIGLAKISGTSYYFKFAGGSFKYSNTLTGTTTTVTPSPAISTSGVVWWATIQDKIYFVDGTNVLRFFNGTTITNSVILTRPTVAPTGGAGVGFDYTYTVDNQQGESPACPTANANTGSAQTQVIAGNTGPQTLVIGDRIRVYSKATTVAVGYKNVTTTSGSDANGTFGSDAGGGYYQITTTAASYNITNTAITDAQVQLYSELGVALNKTAPTGLTGLTTHYGRLVAWKDSTVYNSKVSNASSWPDDSAQKEAFVYGFLKGDGDSIQTCVSYRESLFVMKPKDVAIFGGIGPDDTGNNAYSFRRLETNGNGCIAGKSAVVAGEEDNNTLIYLSRLGFFSTNGDSPIRIGENIEPIIQALSSAYQSRSVAFHQKRYGLYVCTVGAAGSRSTFVLDIRRDDNVLVGWFKWSNLSMKCCFWADDKYIFGTYSGFCVSERNDEAASDFSDVKINYIAPGDINPATEEITFTHGYATGDQVVVRTNGTIPAGLTANTTYFVIRVSANVLKLATSLVNAQADTAINITSQGVGNHSIVGSQAIDAYYTTNWINHGHASIVKKLSKPSIILNSDAALVNISVTTAYDWTESFGDTQTIQVGSSDAWGTLPWGSFVWGLGAIASPKNISLMRRKCRSIRYKFQNSTINQDFQVQGISQDFDLIRNRGNYTDAP